MRDRFVPRSGEPYSTALKRLARTAAITLLVGVSPHCFSANAALPPGWKNADIGGPALAGWADFTNNTWVVTGSGADVCTADQMQFAYTRVAGDVSLLARVGGIENGPTAQAGVSFRSDLTKGAVEASVLVTPSTNIAFQWRATPGANCSYQVPTGVAVAPPFWVRVDRVGTGLSGWCSTNGTTWFQVGSTQIVSTLPLNVLAGLVVSANDINLLAKATFTDVQLTPPAFGVFREKWLNLNPAAGNSLAALTNTAYNPAWPDNPDSNSTSLLNEFETETGTGVNSYGQRLRAFLVPPADGYYQFWIASDDTSELLLSPDETSTAAQRIAWVSTATGSREWTKEANQVSSPVLLEAGVRYYLEGRMQQGTGSDNLAVRWQLPTGAFEEPVPAMALSGTRLIPCSGLSAAPGILVQPTNTTVADGLNAVFTLLVTNQGPVSYRWFLNGSAIESTNAAKPVLVVKRVGAANQNQAYSCMVSNSAGVVTSATAVLTVLVDSTPPTLAGVVYLNTTNVSLLFSERLDVLSATNVSNYTFTNGMSVLQAWLSPDGQTVTLLTSPMVLGSNYVVFLNNLQDLATSPNTIAPNTVAAFTAAPYRPVAINKPMPTGQFSGTPGGYDLSGGGKDIGGASDQLQYAYELRSGDFDIRVRLQDLSPTDPNAKAGLMVREDLSPGSRYAATLATPTFSGIIFQYRATTNGTSASAGNATVNYPQTWLRLQRQGAQFTGYASYDGQLWQLLGSVSLVLSDPVYFGLAACSHNTNTLSTAQFREISDVTNPRSGTLPQRSDIFGPSTRRTGLAVSEIMYHPASRADGKRLEFVEFFNTQPWFEDLSGFQITGDVSYTFPEGTVLAAGTYVVVAAAPEDVRAVYGINNVLGPYTNNFSNKSGTVRLRDRTRGILLEVNYDSKPPWPAEADGAGHSLVLTRPSYGEDDARAWEASDIKGGSPGAADSLGLERCRGVVINEVLSHTDLPMLDAIELFNTTGGEIDLSGCYISDDTDTNKFRVPDQTRIPARGFLAFDERQLGFRLDAAGETVYLVNSNNTRVLDAVRLDPQANSVSAGRYPDGAPGFRPLAAPTLGSSNSRVRVSSVVINEIMYFPISLDDDDQYIELYNNTAQPLSLAGWKFTDGIDYQFPVSAFIAGHGYVVVSKNVSRLLTNYPSLNPGIVYGNFSGTLAHRGERVALGMPEDLVSTNDSGVVSTNIVYVPVSEVTYGTGGRWGQWAHGGGSSLELIDPRGDTTLAANWADSNETAKAPWSTVEYTGVLDNGSSAYGNNQLQLFMMGEGECLVDNVEVFKAGGTNLLNNWQFNNGTSGWYFQGTHWRSGVDSSGGFNGGPCLHVRASGRGDTGANRIRATLSSTLASGTTATLRARVRWLKGDPELLLRLRGNWLEAAGRFAIPANLGTPGAPNSRLVANAPPAIADVSHTPALPAGNGPVVVTARVDDPDSIGAVTLWYRNDSAGSAAVSVAMVDDGTGGDQFAHDGIYSATIPGQNAGTMIAFYIQATDAAPTPASGTFPNDGPARECLVRFGESYIPGAFGNYRTWLTRTNVSRWTSREKNSNDPLDATFVYGNHRVVYNMQTLYSGSPFHTGGYSGPTGSACDYVLHMPDDERVLGANDYVIATLGNLNNDSTYQCEQAAFWVLRELGVPSLHRRYVVMFVNGVRRGPVLEDAQQPSSDVVDEYFANDNDGDLHKIEDWFEFDDAGSGFQYNTATLDNFTTTGGVKKTARYRWNWRPRAVKGSSHDFTNLFNLVDAVHAAQPEPYTTLVQSQVDVEEWMHVFALERLVGNWDSYSYERGKNMYVYKPANEPWALLAWDIDFVWNLGDGPTTGLFGGQDSWINRMRSFGPFQRAYYRAFQNILDGPLQVTRFNAMLDAKYAGLVANGVAATSPNGIKSYATSRRSFLQTQLAGVSGARFNISSTATNNNLLQVNGTAPVKVKSVLFNGYEYPVTWTTVTNWTVKLPLQTGNNAFSITGIDTYGRFVSGASNYLNINYQGGAISPVGQVVINEIMFAPKVVDAEYVELFNNSSTNTFDLSGWRFNGLSYTFPGGTLLGPNKYLVLTKDLLAFTTAYGSAAPVYDLFSGNLQAAGETLTLIRPGPVAGTDLEVAKVRYRPGLPWPQGASGTGASVQLIDPAQDNWRAGNWAVASTNSPPPLQWVYRTATGTATSTPRLYLYLASPGDIYLDDLQLVAGTVAGSGPNLLANGDFESALTATWNLTANFTNSSTSSVAKHSGNSSLHMVATAGGSGSGNAIYQNATLTNGSTYTVSFWYLQSTNGGPLVVRLSGSGLTTGNINPAPPSTPGAVTIATPGAPNSTSATLPAFPPLYINEVEPENLTGITNRAGQRTPWLELFNPSTNSVSLDGLYLANQYANLTAWTFPTGIVLKPKSFKVVFADDRTDLSTTNEPHTSFTLSPAAGALALSRLYLNKPQVLDSVEYTNLIANQSYGSSPDAQSFDHQPFFYVTPGASNNVASAPLTVVLNEWMAQNNSTIRDPVTGAFDDWFELYNYGTNTVQLGGYYLTDTLTNQFKFRIPSGYSIPPKGFLLVWADNKNTNGTPDLHVTFRMNKDGESLGLYGADGRPVDYINYGLQSPDVSQGRYPDGSFSSFIMPEPTPGTNNLVPNTPPALAPIADKVLVLGQTLRLTASAADSDVPKQTLTFSLVNTPIGGSIDPFTGLLLWTPTAAPATNRFAVVVTDDGVPRLSATNAFNVRVYPVPQIISTTVTGDSVSFTVSSIQGELYQLQYCDDLASRLWFPSGPPTPGTGSTLVLSDEIQGALQRFYRIRVSLP